MLITKNKTFIILLSIIIAISISLNISGFRNDSRERKELITRIFINLEYSINCIDAYFDYRDDLSSIESSGIHLIRLFTTLDVENRIPSLSAMAFEMIGKAFLINHNPYKNGIFSDGKISEDEEIFIQDIAFSLKELLKQLKSIDNLSGVNSNLSYEQLNSLLFEFHSNFMSNDYFKQYIFF
jgi:hypothetical protein